jgi:acyl-ACP thioesterase
VLRFPRLDEAIEVATFCSGAAPLWAERSSLVSCGGDVAVEAVAVWVHLQPDGLRPQPLPAGFDAIYGPSAAGRRVRARLRHPAVPPAGAAARPWHFRGADLDLAGHVNNASYWEALEDELVEREPDAGLAAEIEHRAPASAGPATVLADGERRWIVDADSAVVATLTAAPLDYLAGSW